MDYAVTVDFETMPIIAGSGLAPRPVGVAIKYPLRESIYHAWGHPGYNPNTWEEGRRALAHVWDRPLVFHNCKFDIGVAIQHLDLPWPEKSTTTRCSKPTLWTRWRTSWGSRIWRNAG